MIKVILDSSMSYLTVGLASENEIVDYVSYEAWQKQSENLIPDLKRLLEKNHFTKEDIEGVIVTIGPGSYTGTRIALTTAKIMYVALKCKIYPVSTLQALKDSDKPSICLLDARSERSYFGVYEGNKCIEKDQILTNDNVMKYINEHPSFIVRGKASYLGLIDNEANIIKEVLSLDLIACDNPLSLKPVYLKETYL